MRQFYLLPATAILLILYTGCTKNKKYYANDGNIISKTVLKDSIGVLTTHFLYNDADKLIRLQQITDPETIRETNEALLLQYDNAGKLTISWNNSTDNNYYNIHQYTYNSKGDSIQVLVIPNEGNAPNYQYTVILDNAGRAIYLSETLATQPSHIYFNSYTYNNAGDITTAYEGEINNGVSDTTTTIHYTYDTRNNPYHALGLPYYLATGSSKAFNQHNVQTYTTGTTLYTWQHSYNTSNVPERSVLPVNQPASGTVQYDLYYQ